MDVMRTQSIPFVLVALIAMWLVPAGRANTIEVDAVGFDAASEPINFTADFAFSANTLSLTLTNNTSDPISAAETIRSLSFKLPGFTAFSAFAASGVGRTVNTNAAGGYTDSPITVDWSHAVSMSGVYTISATGPDQLVIGNPNGSNAYASAVSSITNGPHNPHLANSPTFTWTISGLQSTSTVSNVVFGNGTESETIAETKVTTHLTVVPLPSSAWMGLALLTFLGFARMLPTGRNHSAR
jgi:hypothetical protein